MKKFDKLLMSSAFLGISFLFSFAFSQQAKNPKIERVQYLANAASKHGLNYSFYFNPAVDTNLQNISATGTTTALDSALSSIVTRITSDLSRGRILPSKAGSKVYIKDKVFAYQALANNFLNSILTAEELVASVAPKNRFYQESFSVLDLLKSYKEQNTWVVKPATLALATVGKKTTNANLIQYLRSKLNSLQYTNDVTVTKYDSGLEAAIKLFQEENNLTADGVVGQMSWGVLEKQIDALISQAILNLDRTRWLPDQNPLEYIYVNLARQTFQYIQNGNEVLSFKTINGRLDRRTPLLVDSSQQIILNPTWTVPRSIFVKDKLDKLRQDPGYALQQKMKVYSDINGKEVDPFSVNWNLPAEQLPYTLVQIPGPWNALGFIKFPLTNPFAIYMHDTSDRKLFAETNRLLSSGCMRLQQPFEVAEKLLASPKWTLDSLKAASEFLPAPADKPTNLSMKKGIPVFAAYKTISLNSAGRLIAVNDPYELDKDLYQIMISGQ